MRLAQRRKLGVKEADYSAFQRFQKRSATGAVRLYAALPSSKKWRSLLSRCFINRTHLRRFVLALHHSNLVESMPVEMIERYFRDKMKEDTSIADLLDWRAFIKAALIFLAAFATYFITRSPGLDEFDSVQFAMGVREFNVWEHQPHPPGYPLFIFLGWIGVKFFGATPELSLHFVSALGGALFIAAWFLIIRLQFTERLGWWVATCLAITPVVWMTATKVLTDSLAAGFLSMELFAGLCFAHRGGRSALLATSLFGAASAGARPQLIGVVLVIILLALKQRAATVKMSPNPAKPGSSFNPSNMLEKREQTEGVGRPSPIDSNGSPRGQTGSIFALGTLLAGCLLWLLPMWYWQSRLRPDVPAWLVYPKLIYSQWQWRLHKPQTFLLAGDWSPRYLALRFANHILGWFGLGLGFLQSWAALIAGILIVAFGLAAYLLRRRELNDRQFWKFHGPWALVHVAIIFVCLPATQRYYLVIYPLLLVALLRGFLRMSAPWNWSALALPALLLSITIPIAIANHREEAPPIRLIRYLQKLYPPSARSRVILLFGGSRRHADWYAPEFVRIHDIPPANGLAEITKGAAAVYTDNAKLPLPQGWRRVPLVEFKRSLVIYVKHHVVRLFLIDRGTSS